MALYKCVYDYDNDYLKSVNVPIKSNKAIVDITRFTRSVQLHP